MIKKISIILLFIFIILLIKNIIWRNSIEGKKQRVKFITQSYLKKKYGERYDINLTSYSKRYCDWNIGIPMIIKEKATLRAYIDNREYQVEYEEPYNFYENIENRNWGEEALDYYEKKISKYISNGYMVKEKFYSPKFKVPLKKGISFEKWREEYSKHISLYYAIFIPKNKKNMIKTEYKKILERVDSAIKPNESRYFTIMYYFVNEEFREEYIKKRKENSELDKKYYKDKLISYEEYHKKSQIFDEWFEKNVYEAVKIREDDGKDKIRYFQWELAKD